jgi:hypothetical protein
MLTDEILERIVRSDEITVVELMRGSGVTQGASPELGTAGLASSGASASLISVPSCRKSIHERHWVRNGQEKCGAMLVEHC